MIILTDEWEEINIDTIRLCEICGKMIELGSKAYWNSGNTRHLDCLDKSLGYSTIRSGQDMGSSYNPPTEQQLDYLKSLGYGGKEPSSSKDASYLIRELLTKKEKKERYRT